MRALGRAGWAARALLYLVTAVLVTRVAAAGRGGGSGGDEASHTGALREIAEQPFGKALLAVLAIGLIAFAVWRAMDAWRDVDDDGGVVRLAHLASGFAYGSLGPLAGSMVLGDAGGGGAGGGGDDEARGATATVLSWPFGPWLVAGVGAALVAVGAYFFWRGVSREFMDDLELGSVSRGGQRAIAAVGVLGACARGAVFAIVGWFVVKAALEFDPNEARGLDRALRELAEATWGRLLLWAVAVGLVAYAVFCGVRARFDRAT